MSERIKEYVFLIDKSISMYGREYDVLNVWNRFLETQKDKLKHTYVTFGMFSEELDCYYIHNELQCAHPLTSHDYYVDGSTAFFDAFCEMCHRVEMNLKMLRENIQSQVEVYILSDGIDNASIYFNEDDYESILKKQEEKGWKIHRISSESMKKFLVYEEHRR